MAAVGETLAVRVMLVPMVVEVLDDVKVVVVDVLPELEVLELQPKLKTVAAASASIAIRRVAG